MDDAFDTFRNQRVWAAAATTSRFPGHYICPLCRTEVALAAGQIVCKHFRHVRGKDHEDCERYSKNFGREVPLSEHEYEHLDAVLVASLTFTNYGGQVAFAVRFRPVKMEGLVKFTGRLDFVSGSRAIQYPIQSDLRQQYFRITSPEKNYLIRVHVSSGGYAQYPVEGFDENPAVFRAIEGEGKAVRIARHRALKPGAHVVVSEKVITKFHHLLAAKPLKTLLGLHATLIEIPENPTWEVQQNVKSILGFSITTKLAVYGFLTPANAYELAPDCWEVSKDTELAIFIRASRDVRLKFTQLLVQRRISGHLSSNYLTWKEGDDELVLQLRPGSLKPDLFRIGLAPRSSSPVSFLFEINFSEEVVNPQCARILFQFASSKKGKVRLKWSAHELPKMLLDAKYDVGTSLSINNKPESVEITVSDSRGQRVTIPEVTGGEKLLAYFRQARFPCVLSASGHPDIIILGKKRNVEQTRPLEEIRTPTARCRRHARMVAAYKSGHVSEYSVRAIAL